MRQEGFGVELFDDHNEQFIEKIEKWLKTDYSPQLLLF